LILYSKDTKFLGASADILSILGYEDINVFMSYNNDIADLFVNRPGYVHKFDNFSWISYVLNGSLPNKNVIIKTRNGGEIESSISISEIFLTSDDDKYYIVNLNSTHQLPGSVEKNAAEHSIPDKQPIFKIKDELVEPTVKIADFTISNDTATVENNTTPAEATPEISFKFDEKDIKPDINTTDITAADDTIKILPEKTDKNDVVQQNLQQKNTPKVEKVIDIKIDTQEISDLLGISETDVVKYMHEYISYLDANINHLKDLYENDNISQAKKVVVNLIGIGSNLRAKEVVQVLKKLLAVGAGTHNASTLQETETVIGAFKQSVSKL